MHYFVVQNKNSPKDIILDFRNPGGYQLLFSSMLHPQFLAQDLAQSTNRYLLDEEMEEGQQVGKNLI